MKRLLFFMFAVTLLVACDEKADVNSLSVSDELLEFSPTGGSADFEIKSNQNWEILIASNKADVILSDKSGTGDATITVTLPSTSSIQDVETRLIVRTDDGSGLCNVVLLQHGHLTGGATLYVSNHNNLLMMDGKSHATDSLTIVSNVAWQLKGPEWIEAYDGTSWVKLSPDRANVSGAATVKDKGEQTFNLQIRSVSENQDDDNRVGMLILQPSYESSDSYEIEVSQMGRYNVQANVLVTLSNAMGWRWKCGIGVEKIACYIGETMSTDITQWYESKPDDPCGIDGLNPNTLYYIWSQGFDKNWLPDGENREAMGVGYFTCSRTEQPLATISNVKYDGNQFTWTVTQNQYSYMYAQMILHASDPWASANDGYMALIFNEYLHSATSEISTLYTHRQRNYNFVSQENIHIATWGIVQGNNNTQMSGLISRYTTNQINDSPSSVTEQQSKFFSHPVNIDELKKSVILIKK